MKETKKASDRLAVLEKIDEYEKNGFFDKDVEQDPPSAGLDPNKIDFLKKKLFNKLKARIANFVGAKFFEKSLKRKEVIFSGVTGLNNLDGFKGGAIITCNHCHRFDNYAILLGLKKFFKRLRLYKVVRDGNYAFKGKVGFILRNCDTLPISEKRELTSACMQAVKTLVKRGKKILIYPEQGMWWNYRKPRPLKKGAFLFAVKANAPIIPCFITLNDSDITGKDGFKIQEFTLNVLPVIYIDKNLSDMENCEKMREKNYALWKNFYEKHYKTPLIYKKDEERQQ
ncbi:MAG: 1-acyl-sn-glycerol-3-phosphate acyltransferase [Firmicutes bacterium]|nr:1-acyl-sn-glycerol-3-phosphate acyltransferase [Bacillota bacterium]